MTKNTPEPGTRTSTGSAPDAASIFGETAAHALPKLLDDSGLALARVSATGALVWANRSWCSLFGAPLERLSGLQLTGLFRNSVLAEAASPDMLGNAVNKELSFRNFRGTTCWVRLSAVLEDSKGACLVLLTDITALKEEKRQLEKAETLVQTIADRLPAMVAYLDRDLRFRFVNELYETAYRQSRSACLGKTYLEVHGSQAWEPAREYFERTLTGEAAQFETVLDYPEGGKVHALVKLTPDMKVSGEAAGLFVHVTDVTEIKLLEEQLRHSQRLETAGLLAGGIAHDFNNILTVIQGYCSLLVTDASENEPGNAARISRIKAIEAAAQKAAALTRQLLAFSQKQRSDARVFNPSDQLEELAQILQRALGEDIALVTEFESKWSIRDDPANFEQVVLNLAINARQAMPDGGTLVINTGDVELSASDPLVNGKNHSAYIPGRLRAGAYVRVSVVDNGCGMESGVVERIFEPFFTTRDKNEGSGLGLSVVYGVVTQNGGGLSVESATGKGTRVDVYLPRCADADGSKSADGIKTEPETVGGRKKGNILLVEDNPDVLQLATTILEAAGYKVFAEQDARKALTRELPRIDLVLSDVVMPELSGPDFIIQWLEVHPGTRYLFMSGYADESILPYSVRENLVQKPFRPADLLEKIRACLASSPAELIRPGNTPDNT